MIFLFTTLILFFVAIKLGAWRHQCIFWEARMPFNTPSYWRSGSIRVFTWLITTALSVACAFVWSNYLMDTIGDLVGKFMFGVILYARWQISAMLAYSVAMPELEKIMHDQSRTVDENSA